MSTANPLLSASATPQASAIHVPYWVFAGLAAALVVALFGKSFLSLAQLWNRDPNYSHGYLVGPISLVLAYYIARRVGPPLRGELAFGLLSIVFGILCQSAAMVVRWPLLNYIALFCVCRGLLVCAGGRTWAAKFNFPLAFLFFMFPLPMQWTGYAALWLQDVVSRVSESVLSLFVVCHRVGHSIRIAGVESSLVVAEECSGIGQIVAFLAFSTLLGHVLARPTWHRVLLVALSVPIAIAANTLRVVLMNLGAVWFGTKWMSGVLHDAPVLFSLPVGIALFLFVDHLIAGITAKRQSATPAVEAPTNAPATCATNSRSCGCPRLLFVGSLVLAVGVGLQFALAAHLQASGEMSYPPLRAEFAVLPLEWNDPATGQLAWRGQDFTELRDTTRAKLPFTADDLLLRGYQHASGAQVHLYMVYSRAGEDRKHHPEICIRDCSGAPEDLSFRQQIPLTPDGKAAAQRFRFHKGMNRVSVVYYWHYTPMPAKQLGRTTLQTLHQQLGVASPSVTVQVSCGTDDPRVLASVEQHLLPAINAAAHHNILPAGTLTECNRVPMTLSRE